MSELTSLSMLFLKCSFKNWTQHSQLILNNAEQSRRITSDYCYMSSSMWLAFFITILHCLLIQFVIHYTHDPQILFSAAAQLVTLLMHLTIPP